MRVTTEGQAFTKSLNVNIVAKDKVTRKERGTIKAKGSPSVVVGVRSATVARARDAACVLCGERAIDMVSGSCGAFLVHLYASVSNCSFRHSLSAAFQNVPGSKSAFANNDKKIKRKTREMPIMMNRS